jgi:GDPmannose 4,6-dehydratase
VVVNYREAYGLFACNGILFNHESPRRGETFVTRKITLAAARILHGLQEKVRIGNLEAKRDWGYAPEFTEAMRLMLNHTEPGDYVVATGETHTVREFTEAAFREAGMELAWEKRSGVEVGVEKKTGKIRVEQDASYYRPTEVDLLIGDASKAGKILGWQPKTKFADLVKLMVKADVDKVGKRGY